MTGSRNGSWVRWGVSSSFRARRRFGCRHGVHNGVEKQASGNRFPEAIDAADLPGLFPDLRFVARGKHDDRCGYTLGDKAAAQLEPGNSAKLDVEDNAIEAVAVQSCSNPGFAD